MGALTLLVPWWGRALAILAVAATLFGYGWLKGAGHEERKAEALRVAQERANIAEVQRLATLSQKVVYQYMDKWHVVEKAGAIQIREVTKYVTAQADSHCIVNRGFVELWGAHIDKNTVSSAPADLDAAAPGVALSTVGRGITEAKIAFEENKVQCEALQAWAADLANTKSR